MCASVANPVRHLNTKWPPFKVRNCEFCLGPHSTWKKRKPGCVLCLKDDHSNIFP